MQKVYYFKNLLWVLLIFIALLITFQACERDNILLEPVNKQNIKTVTKADAFYHLQNNITMNRSGTSFVTEIDDAVVYDSLINSDEMLATIAVQTQFVNANSRILMIEINDTIQTAVYNMFSKNNFETDTFYGDVLITDLDGNILNALKVEDGYYVAQYLLPENFSVSSNVYSRSGGCQECPEFVDCNMCGELGEVVVTSTKKIKVNVIYCYFCLLSQGDQPENESIDAEWSGPGGSNNSDPNACPTGYIRDDNNKCVPQCPEGEEWVESLQQCAPKCDSGFVRDVQGNCVKKPCEGDPVDRPRLAAQKGKSGILGATFGCTRYGGGCVSPDGRNKMHGGLDILNEKDSPVFAMFDGVVLNKYHQPDGAGHALRIRSELPSGEIIIYQYFHLKENSMLPNNTVVKAGDIIGIQGDSGNLRGAIASGGVDSHVHIRINTYSGAGNSYDYNNFKNQLVNPNDYIKTKFDENGNIIDNNCD
jgi:hypothetical protein